MTRHYLIEVRAVVFLKEFSHFNSPFVLLWYREFMRNPSSYESLQSQIALQKHLYGLMVHRKALSE
jgi:hypothetical protein